MQIRFDPHDPKDRAKVREILKLENAPVPPMPDKPSKKRPGPKSKDDLGKIVKTLHESTRPMRAPEIAKATGIGAMRVSNYLYNYNGTLFLRVAAGQWRAKPQ